MLTDLLDPIYLASLCGHSFPFIVIAAVASAGTYAAYANARHIAWVGRLNTMGFDWYRAEHPECIQGGRLSCFRCQSRRVGVRGLNRHTYMREHFCVQCGSALYYSAEAQA